SKLPYHHINNLLSSNVSSLATAVLPDRTQPALENVGYDQWTPSTQAAAELLRDIEQQVAEYQIREFFTLRKLDSSTIRVKNPIPGFHPNGRPKLHAVHPETYHCTCLVDWENNALTDFEGLAVGWEALAQQEKTLWENSETHQLLHTRIRALVGPGTGRKANKVVCIGLPYLSRRPPVCWRAINCKSETPESEVWIHKGSIAKYGAAMTIADALREIREQKRDTTAGCPEGTGVRLLTQDYVYSEATKAYVRGLGFQVVGDYGAGGFAEIDDETVVFCCARSTLGPIKQVVADIARPAIFIGLFGGEDINQYWQPCCDLESPRTRKVWKGYGAWSFPVAAKEVSSLDPIFKRLVVKSRLPGVGSV
ncbi:hypothetical protein PG988_007366, partial [Apiospora saccharicola]